jgi:hypothetical protein
VRGAQRLLQVDRGAGRGVEHHQCVGGQPEARQRLGQPAGVAGQLLLEGDLALVVDVAERQQHDAGMRLADRAGPRQQAGGGLHQAAVAGLRLVGDVEAQRVLRVEVDRQHLPAALGERGAEIGGDRGLAYTALGGNDGDDDHRHVGLRQRDMGPAAGAGACGPASRSNSCSSGVGAAPARLTGSGAGGMASGAGCAMSCVVGCANGAGAGAAARGGTGAGARSTGSTRACGAEGCIAKGSGAGAGAGAGVGIGAAVTGGCAIFSPVSSGHARGASASASGGANSL